MVLEDLHWASNSTLQMLHHLARHLSGLRFCSSARSGQKTSAAEDLGSGHPLLELHRQLARDGVAQQLDLPRLSPASVTTIIQEMSGAWKQVRPLAERLYQETEGNPFFLMESIKALFETDVIQLKEGIWQGDFTLVSGAKPPLTANLSDAVQAWVRRLGKNAQAALGLAAVLGREFNFEPFNQAWGKGEQATLEALDELLRHRLVEEKFGPHDRDFAFTHHKIQEVVYHALPRHRRFHLHARVGAALETSDAAEPEARAGELAHHFEQACLQDKSLSSKAIHYLLQAGQQAVGQSANQEAVTYYQRGLDIIHAQPETEPRMQQEVELQLALAVPIKVIKGYTSPEVRRIYDRARDLCRMLGHADDRPRSAGFRNFGASSAAARCCLAGERLLIFPTTGASGSRDCDPARRNALAGPDRALAQIRVPFRPRATGPTSRGCEELSEVHGKKNAPGPVGPRRRPDTLLIPFLPAAPAGCCWWRTRRGRECRESKCQAAVVAIISCLPVAQVRLLKALLRVSGNVCFGNRGSCEAANSLPTRAKHPARIHCSRKRSCHQHE